MCQTLENLFSDNILVSVIYLQMSTYTHLSARVASGISPINKIDIVTVRKYSL